MAYNPAVRLDGRAALARANTHTTWPTGQCLGFVDQMFQKPTSDRPGWYTTAARARDAVPVSRRYQGESPAGAVEFFTNGSAPGHVVISAGGGMVRSTDKPSSGRVATVSRASIIASWGGRPFAFWTDWLMGYDITNLGTISTAGSGGSPIQEDDMISDDQMTKISQMIQRENRYRLYTNSSTGAIMALHIISGDIMDNTHGAAEIATWQRLQLVGHGENSVTVLPAEWDALRERAATIRGVSATGSVDLSPLTKAIAAIKLPAVPTAAENGAAARAAIVK